MVSHCMVRPHTGLAPSGHRSRTITASGGSEVRKASLSLLCLYNNRSFLEPELLELPNTSGPHDLNF